MKQTVLYLLRCVALTCVFLAGALSVQAVTLDEVLRDVVATNPMILEKQKAYNAALEEQRVARSGYFPKVIFSGDVGYKAYRDSGTGYENEDDGFYDARVTLSQLLYDWGKTSSLEEARKNFMLSSLYGYVSKANQVTYETIIAYLNVLKYNELQELAAQNVLTHENLLTSIQMQVDQGAKGRSELERINGRMASAQSKLLLRQNDYKQAVYNLHKMLGRFTPVEEMVMPKLSTEKLPASLKEALELQRQFNPLLREAFYNIEQKKWEHENKKSEYWGRLSLEGVASIENEFEDEDEYETEASIALRYRHTLFDTGRPHRVQSAASQVHAEQQKQYRVRRVLLNDIQLSWAAHKLLNEQIGVLKKNLYFTRRSLESYKEEFILGRRDLINILDAQNEHLYINEQLIDAIYSKEVEKYKILYSEGVLLTILGLLNPQAQAMLERDDTYKPLSKDDLPLGHDFDRDSVPDDVDISVNSRAKTVVNNLGVNKRYDISYIYEVASDQKDHAENIIGPDGSLKEHPITLNVTTRFNFDAFLQDTLRLSPVLADKMMRELVEQAKTYSVETPLYIMVSTNEYDDANKNYNLALQRAYNLKRILQRHKVDEKGVFVFADTNAPKGHNILRLTFTDKISGYERQYRTRSVYQPIFANKENRIENFRGLNAIISAINHHNGRAEIILYSNEMPTMETSRQLGLQRAELLGDYLAKKGLGPDKVTILSWGGFKADPLLAKSRTMNQFLQYVLRDPGQ